MAQRLCYATAHVVKDRGKLSIEPSFRALSKLSFLVAKSQSIQRKQHLTLCRLYDKAYFTAHNVNCKVPQTTIFRYKSNGKDKDLSSLIQPIPVKPVSRSPDDINIGVELSGSLQKDDLLRVLNQFLRRPEVKKLAAENGLDQRLFHQAYLSFRRFCVESEQLPVDIHIVFSDILQQAENVHLQHKRNLFLKTYHLNDCFGYQASHPSGHVDDIFPYFLNHAREIFPHLNCMEDLRKISDIRVPANWYPEARAVQRKIVFHAGPTNSGKTHHALERFMNAKSGVYCGPLKLLASEVFHKSNAAGTPCDLVTGEERLYADPDSNPSTHVACTVEMTSTTTPYEVGVIDEIQMIRDPQRGWAWSRVLLGLCANEVHLCGEAAALDLVQELMLLTGDEVEVRRYKRLTKLTYLDHAVESFDSFRPGDCVVCFSKNDIYYISRQLERRGKQCAVIYGGLPPGTKLAQAQKFNDPNDPCQIMVATDAIGMGLNLSIRRIIFYSLVKPHLNEKGEKEMDVISTSQALQISGRAGRYGTSFEEGEVTTYKKEDLPLLKDVVSRPIELIELAGLHPTAEQIELFAYHLPNATLSNLIDIFVTLCHIDSDKYFMCNVDDFKFLADMIEHVPLSLRARYVFCCAPIPKKQPFVCTMFLKFARQYSRAEPLTLDWLCRQIGSPFGPPETIMDLVHLEAVFDVLDLYLWLSYRFADQFPDTEHVRYMQSELDALIQTGMLNITRLIVASETSIAGAPSAEDDEFEMKRRISKSTMAKQVRHIDDESTLQQSRNVNSGYHVYSSNNRRNKDRRKIDEDFDDRDSIVDNRNSRTSLSSNFIRAKNHNNIDSAYESKGSKLKPGKGQLTTELIKQGILTPEMLSKLEAEWKSNGDGNKHGTSGFRRGRGHKNNTNDDS